MARVRLRRIEVMPAAVWLSLLAALVGFFLGIVLECFSFAAFGLRYGFHYILLWVVCTPVVFSVIGFLASVIGVAIYNSLVGAKGECS